jgi:hypothetical protein
MRTWLRKTLVGLLSLSMAFMGVVAAEQPSSALDARTFDPGLIISDAVFNDWGTMNAAQIQKFLEARVPTCTDDDGGPKCLRNYKENVVGTYAIRSTLHSYSLHICADVPAASNQTGAQIIYSIAIACRINPRVLIVTLQKEQGLITAADPTTYMYKAAMGYACPDSAPQVCGQDSNPQSRLFYQMYRAAWQLRWYGDPRGSFTYLKPGNTINMGYHPNSSCGKKSFKLKSQATAKLYYYTPYTPNAAALNNLWGSGDSCSAYGNRNFWRTFWTWFGSPVAGSYLLKSSSNDTYLVNQDTNKRYLITDAALIDDFAPLGPVGTISDAYMASFADGGELKRLVQDATTAKRYLIVSGLKYEVATTAQATTLGLDWANAPVLTNVQLSIFDNLTFAKSATSGEVFLLQGATRALISDPALLEILKPIGGTAVLSDDVLGTFQLVDPVTSLVMDTAGLRYNLLDGKKIPLASSAVASAVGLNWNNATTISTTQLAKITTASFIKATGAASSYLLSEGKKHLVGTSMATSVSKFGATAIVPADFATRFPSGTELTPLLKTATDTWYVSGSQKFKATQAQVTAMGLDWSKSVLISSTQSGTLTSPILMKTATGTTTYLVDGYTDKYPLATADLPIYSSFGSVGVVPAAYLGTFNTKGDPGRFVNGDDGYHYYLASAKRYRVASAATAAEIAPASFGSTPAWSSLPTLSTTELTKFTVDSTTKYITTYVKDGNTTYVIEDGKRREVLDTPSLSGYYSTVPAVSVLSAASFGSLPLGNPVIANETMFQATDSSAQGVFVSGTFYNMPKAMFDSVKTAPTWRFTKSTGSLSAASLAKTTKGTALAPFVVTDNVGYLLSADGKTEISDIQNVIAAPTALPAVVTTLIDRASGDSISTPIVVKDSNAATISYYVANRLKRPSFDSEEGIAISALRSNSTVKIWPAYALDAIASGTMVISPGRVVKVKESGNIYIIDGWGRGLRMTRSVADAFGTASMKTVTRANLAGYNTLSSLPWQKVTCAGITYLVDAGKLTRIDAASVSQWPGTAVALDATTCSRYQINAAPVGVFVSNGTTKYKVIGGKLKPIRTPAEYTTLLGNGVAAAAVSKKLIGELPKLIPTSYVVVKGDTLYKVAVKFGVTRAQLRSLNNLTTDVLTIGQVLKLP